jgi:hypothetical protein
MSLLINQIQLVSAIFTELDRQHPGAQVSPRQLNECIRAANIIVEAMRIDDKLAQQGMGLAAWLASDDTGISSLTMAAVMYQDGRLRDAKNRWCHPWDAGDFGRCHRFLEAVPGSRDLLPKMRDVSPVWAALVDRWDDITALYLEEKATGTKAPKCYALINELVEANRNK